MKLIINKMATNLQEAESNLNSLLKDFGDLMSIIKCQQSDSVAEESSLMEIEHSLTDHQTQLHKQAQTILLKLIHTQTQLHAGIDAVKTMQPAAMEASLLLDLDDLA